MSPTTDRCQPDWGADYASVMPRKRKKKWHELTSAQQTAIIVAGVIEFVVTGIALNDLIHRSSTEVRGRKMLWGMAFVVQPIGPLAYLTVGRSKN